MDAIDPIEKKDNEDELYPEKSRVDFKRFQEIFERIKENSRVDVKVHWDQIKFILKGSVEAIVQNKCLSQEQYLNTNLFPYKRVRLTAIERKDVYAVFIRYKVVQRRENLWDDVDKVNDLQNTRPSNGQSNLQPDAEKTCDLFCILSPYSIKPF